MSDGCFLLTDSRPPRALLCLAVACCLLSAALHRDMVTITLHTDLTRIQRTNLETCITVHMHQKEATEELVHKKVRVHHEPQIMCCDWAGDEVHQQLLLRANPGPASPCSSVVGKGIDVVGWDMVFVMLCWERLQKRMSMHT